MLGGGCFVGNEDISCFDLLWQDNDGGVGDLYHFTFFFFLQINIVGGRGARLSTYAITPDDI